jgi:hypothetical protein
MVPKLPILQYTAFYGFRKCTYSILSTKSNRNISYGTGFCIFIKFSLGAILRTARTSCACGSRLPIGGDQGHRNRHLRSWDIAPTRGRSRMVDLRQTGMDRHRSYVSAPRSWHGSSSNTRACESRRRVVVFSENQNRIAVNELGLGPLSADETRMAL